MSNALRELSKDDRKQLFRFLTAAIWSDGEAAPEEIDLLTDVLLESGLEKDEMQYVAALLQAKPRVEEILRADQVPLDHREILVAFIREAVLADGEVTRAEIASVKSIGDALGGAIALPDATDEEE